jgi:2-polyprenyl-3-methyl-5-hydroxy-6-metoxy-1,4-benzoquinol methylase
MSKDFWDKRYSEEQFAYGTKPNEFYKEQIEKMKPGKAFFLGEGEGRNAVFAAKLGWQVDAVDFSEAAKEKALWLAKKNDVEINYTVKDFHDFDFKKNYYDLVVMIFLHLPSIINQKIFVGSISSLKQKGKLLIETFNKEQINNPSGGPKDPNLLFSEKELFDFTSELKIEILESKSITLDEGLYHKGKADVIRFLGEKY